MKTYHKEGEFPSHSFCGSCGKKMTTSYIATHSLRFHDLTPCLDCGDWFEGLSLLEYHLQVSWDRQRMNQGKSVQTSFFRIARRARNGTCAITFLPKPTAGSRSLVPVTEPT